MADRRRRRPSDPALRLDRSARLARQRRDAGAAAVEAAHNVDCGVQYRQEMFRPGVVGESVHSHVLIESCWGGWGGSGGGGPCPWHLQYEGEGDAGGLVYLLGTRFLRLPFSNPAEAAGRGAAPLVGVAVSSADDRSAQPCRIFDRHDNNEREAHVVQTSWRSETAPWLCMELGGRRSMQVHRYSLRGGRDANEAMLDWELQGRTPEGEWVTILSHVGDRTLLDASRTRSGTGWASWVVWDEAARAQSVHALRIVMSCNISGTTRLLVSGLEVYGILRDPDNPAPVE